MSDEYPYEGVTFGDYQLIRGLGHGGFADVYLGADVTLGKSVAVKVMNTRFPRKEQIDKFKREARFVAGLEHRHIVEVYRYGVEDHAPYIVMKYAPHGNVRHKHPRGTRLNIETIGTYIRQVAEALQHAHNQGLIHRDIKPENMLFGAFGEVLLSDFGIAILSDTKRTSLQEIAGTLPYMAPEQFEAKAVRQSDQYALGIVVYEWLTGDIPFHVDTIYDAAVQHKSRSVPPMNKPGVFVPPEIVAIIIKALAKAPQDRFPTIMAFAEAFEKAIHWSSTIPTIGARLWTYQENEAEVLSVVWSSDDVRIVTGNSNGTDRAIDSLSGKTLHIHIPPKGVLDTDTQVIIETPLFSRAIKDIGDLIDEIVQAKDAQITISGIGSLTITGLNRGPVQRWEVVPTSIFVSSLLDSDLFCGVFIEWNNDCTSYQAYYVFSTPFDPEASIGPRISMPVTHLNVLLHLLLSNSEYLPYRLKDLGRIFEDNPPYAAQELKGIVGGGRMRVAVAWSRRGEVMAIATKKGLRIIDFSHRQMFLLAEETAISALAWSPKNRVLVAGTANGIITLRTDIGDKPLSIKVGTDPINAIAWNSAGTQIAVAHGHEVSLFQVK